MARSILDTDAEIVMDITGLSACDVEDMIAAALDAGYVALQRSRLGEVDLLNFGQLTHRLGADGTMIQLDLVPFPFPDLVFLGKPSSRVPLW